MKNHLKENDLYVSRDDIRFSLVKEGEDYFSKEKEVFNKFSDKIDHGLWMGMDVYADATHLNSKSRLKLLRKLTIHPDEISVIWLKTPLEIALERNESRKGTRSYVPREQLRRMFYSIEEPSFEEGIQTLYIIEPGKCIKIKELRGN